MVGEFNKFFKINISVVSHNYFLLENAARPGHGCIHVLMCTMTAEQCVRGLNCDQGDNL